MSKFRTIRNSFLAGQISPNAVGRTDIPQYNQACELMRNMIPRLSGGAYRRPGTINVDKFPCSTDHPLRILPFVVSRSEAYALVIGQVVGGSSYINYYINGQPGTGGVTGGTVSGTPPYVFQSTVSAQPNGTPDDDIFTLQYTQSTDALYLVHPKYKPQIIKRSAANTFAIVDFDNGLTGQDLAKAYPYLNQNSTAITLTVNTASVGTGRTLTASASVFNAKHVGAIFRIDGGSTVGAVKVTAFTNATTVTVSVLVAIDDTNPHATWWEAAWSDYRGWPRAIAIFQQRLCAAGTDHQPDSTWFSETGNYAVFSVLNDTAPAGDVIVNGAQISVAGGYINFEVDDSQGNGQTTGPTGGQPFRITLSQNQLNAIQWLSPDKELLIGTSAEEWLIAPQNGSFDIANSPTGVQSKYGSDYLMPQRIGYELIFALNTQSEVRAYQYNYIDSSFFGDPVQLFFDQYPKAEQSSVFPGRRKFRWMDWDVTRSTLWCLDTAGNFFGMTRDRKLGVTSWHTHQMGGYDTTKGVNISKGLATDPAYATCDGSVISFAVIPNPLLGAGINDIWMIVKRSPGGVTEWQLERLSGRDEIADTAYSPINPIATACEPLYVDAAYVNFDNATPTDFTYSVGAYLEGYTLEGTYYSATYGIFKTTTGEVVAGDAVLTQSPSADYGANVNTIVLGLHYDSIIQPTRPDAGAVIGTAQSAIKRINRAFVRFYKTMAAKFGSAPSSETTSSPETIVFNLPGMVLAKSPELFTGDKKVLVPSTYERDAYMYLIQDQPLPFSVVAIIAEGQEFD